MEYRDICTKREYEQNGQKKVSWLKVGTLRIVDEEKMFIELNILPTTSLYVFKKKEKSAAPSGNEDFSNETF